MNNKQQRKLLYSLLEAIVSYPPDLLRSGIHEILREHERLGTPKGTIVEIVSRIHDELGIEINDPDYPSVYETEEETFLGAWRRLEEDALVDGVGGVQFARVNGEWHKAGRPRPVRKFILQGR